MANRLFTSQFSYSFERQPVSIMSSFAQTDLGAFASLVSNGITWTAVTMGSAGNSITIAVVAGGTAGAEVVTVSGNAISVQIESGVSTRTQVLTAVQASVPASALVGISVASGGTAASLLAATPLAGGDDTDFTQIAASSACSLSQIDTGVYKLQMSDSYAALLSFDVMIQRASAVDLMAQVQSVSFGSSSDSYVIFRIQAAATPTNLANSDVLYIKAIMRNSGNQNG